MSAKSWDRRFLRIAFDVGRWSKDPRKGVGAVLVSPDRRRWAHGYNGFPSGIEDTTERLKDEATRLRLTVHAELNCLLNASFDTDGCALYSTQFPCHECAKAIIQKRVGRVVAPTWEHRTDSKWRDSWLIAGELLAEANVGVTLFHFGSLEDHILHGGSIEAVDGG